jgi:hypothetical protein
MLTRTIRCTAPSDNLDDDVDAIPCTQHYTESLVNLIDSRTLWTDYGIDDDIIVCHFSNSEFSTLALDLDGIQLPSLIS